jgi:hypothetical protein
VTDLNHFGCSSLAMTSPVAFVLLDEARLPDEKVLIEALRRRHPGLQCESRPARANAKADDYRLIRAGHHMVAILLMTAPIPFNQLLWQRASSTWPDAFQAVERHRAHLAVSVLEPAAEGDEMAKPRVIERTRLLTAIVGSLIDAQSGCLGVVWNGRVGCSPEEWREQSLRSFEPFPDHPYSLWIEIVHFVSGQTIGAYTSGLSTLVGREIEFEVDGLDQHDVTDRVARVSSYLIADGLDQNLASGTVYEDDDENVGVVAVLHRNSRFGIGPVVSFFSLHDRAGRLKTYQIIPASLAQDHPLLVMLSKVGLFDPTESENRIQLRPDHYVSESRLEQFDDSLARELSEMRASEAYAECDRKARHALASGDNASARSALLPWAEKVRQLQKGAKLALTLCDVFMFMPAAPRSPAQAPDGSTTH